VAVYRVRREPFLWAVLIASLQTLVVAANLARGAVLDLRMAITVAIGVFFWSLVAPTVRVRELVRAHPDLFVSRSISGRLQRAPADASPTRLRSERRSARRARSGRRTSVLVGAIVIALAGVAGFAAWRQSRPPPLEPSLEAFRMAWNASDIEAAGAAFVPASRERLTVSLQRVAERRGWDALPAIERVDVRRDGRRAQVTFWTLEGGLETAWEVDGERWVLRSLRPPR
jgi:hypothetical protein